MQKTQPRLNQGGASSARRSRKARFSLENLEGRELLSGDILYGNATVSIRGSVYNDVAVVRFDDNGTPDRSDDVLHVQLTQGVVTQQVDFQLAVTPVNLVTFAAGAGDDTFMNMSNINSNVFLDAGNDVAVGGGGNDVFTGYFGNDMLLGNGGDDILMAGSGLDYLDGGTGRDQLRGGSDGDTLIGGADADTFYTTSKLVGFQNVLQDSIRDYKPAEGDRIVVLTPSPSNPLPAPLSPVAEIIPATEADALIKGAINRPFGTLDY